MNILPFRFLLGILILILLIGTASWVYIAGHQTHPRASPVVVSQEATTTSPADPVKIMPTLYNYIEVVEGCGPYYEGTCVNMRSGPGKEYSVVERLRTGMVLKVSGTVTGTDGHDWYKIDPGPNLRYPERVKNGWYVLADAVQAFKDDGDHQLQKGTQATTTKRILVDLSSEKLSAYDGTTLFMQESISTGLNLTPTPVGKFTIYAKTPTRYMQGPIPGVSDQAYDLPGVPWDLYFTTDGAVIHGAYWHDHFGEPWSHGCVNLSPDNAKKLYYWADVGTPVVVTN